MDFRVFFKSAGLIDCNELGTMKHEILNCDKFMNKALQKPSIKTRVTNEKKEMVNRLFLTFANTPMDDLRSSDKDKKTVSSKRRRLQLSPSVPTRMGLRMLKNIEKKRGILLLGYRTRADWQTTIASRKGKVLKVKAEDKDKILF